MAKPSNQIKLIDFENMAYVERIIRDYIIGCDEEVMWGRRAPDDVLRARVNCNDTFWWACADSEVIEPHEIDDLIACSKEFSTGDKPSFWGDVFWVCKKRNMYPQKPIMDKLKVSNPDLHARLLEFNDPGPS